MLNDDECDKCVVIVKLYLISRLLDALLLQIPQLWVEVVIYLCSYLL